jgi:hypothetical protein
MFQTGSCEIAKFFLDELSGSLLRINKYLRNVKSIVKSLFTVALGAANNPTQPFHIIK